MKRAFFGTDGIRGAYGGPVLTDQFAARLGRAVAEWVGPEKDQPLVIAIGRDTRASGPALRDAFACGVQSYETSKIIDLGVLPTPAIAVFVRNIRADLGVAITASHNPASDNGIKFFNSAGLKLSDAQELEIEALLLRNEDVDTSKAPTIEVAPEGVSAYLDLLQPTLQNRNLEGIRIVVDAAHGAASQTTPALLKGLGAEVFVYGSDPDGQNINDGVGSQHPEYLSKKVLEHEAHVGIAHDGDADRLLVCDELGVVVPGDVLLGLLGLHELKAGNLRHDTLVATQQSNLGLDRCIEKAGGKVIRTSIGDRYVLKEMVDSGYNVGGESSGHIIFKDLNTTGDGLAAALKLLALLVDEGESLSNLQQRVPLFPQVTGAEKVVEKKPLETVDGIQRILESLEAEMGESGRVLLRYSGTENKVRLLVEGEDASDVERWYERLLNGVREYLT